DLPPSSISHDPMSTATTDNSRAKKKKDLHHVRVIPPLAAAPATERSERVGEEAEVNRKPH
ncbi:hypothetical protein M9570_24450, partial [Salmonella sp. SC43]